MLTYRSILLLKFIYILVLLQGLCVQHAADVMQGQHLSALVRDDPTGRRSGGRDATRAARRCQPALPHAPSQEPHHAARAARTARHAQTQAQRADTNWRCDVTATAAQLAVKRSVGARLS